MKRWSILVVEDDALFLESLLMLLEEEGFDAVGARSAEEALKAGADRHFDLIITDVRMPGTDGITMLDRVRRESPRTRAIVITGYSEFQVPVEAVRIQIDDFIPKPFDKQAFLASVRRSLEWLEREAWWENALRLLHQEAVDLVEALLVHLGSTDPEARESWGRRRALLRAAGRLLGHSGDDLAALAWADWILSGCGEEAREVLRRHVEGATPIEADVGRRTSGGDRGDGAASIATTLRTALRHAREIRLLESGATGAEAPGETLRLLEAVRRVDRDMAGEPAEAVLSRLRKERAGSPRVLDALARATEAAPVALDDGTERATPRSVVALGLGYLHAGRADMARDVLVRVLAERSVDGPTSVESSASAWLSLALAQAACGDRGAALEAAERGLALADTALEEAEALAVRGTVRVAAGQVEGADEVEEAAARFRLHGSRRGEVRCWLHLSWAWSRRTGADALSHLRGSLGRVLDAIEGTGLEWTLRRDRWLSVPVLRHARQAGIEAERAGRWLARLGAAGDVAESTGRGDIGLRVEGFGRLAIWVGSREVREEDWKTTKSKWLFVVLLLHGGREVPDERLMDLFWEAQDADRARQNLYSTLTYVRKALGAGEGLAADPVIHRRGHCQFNRALSHRVDFLEFDEMLRKGLALWDRGEPEQAVPHLVAALDSYQGDLLENHDEPFIHAYRRSYRDRALQALEHLLVHHQRGADRVAAVATAERILSVDACHQGAYQCLMRAALEAGQPERAARLYRACVRAMREDLHMSPSAQTTALYQQIVGSVETEAHPR